MQKLIIIGYELNKIIKDMRYHSIIVQNTYTKM